MILPPSLGALGSLDYAPDPYMQQVLYRFNPMMGGPALVLSLCVMFNRVACLRCLGCEQEIWQTAAIMPIPDHLRDKLIAHVGNHLQAAVMEVQQVQ